MYLTRRAFTAGLAFAKESPLRKIAHRGGIVDNAHAENSKGSIEAAIERGYWMIEVDVRSSSDGEPLLQHDATLERFYGVKQRPEDLTWKELSALKSNPGGTTPIHFDTLCRMAKGKIRLMLDIKNNTMPEDFYKRMARSMAQANLLDNAYMLGGDRWRKVFGEGGTKESANRTAIAAAAERGEPVRDRYFLFELASDLNEESFDLTEKLGVDCVAAVNDFRYVMAKRDTWEGPKEDIARLWRLGVRSYQIDSKYEPLLLERR
jgi:glycerophosphoryl diester phosphodiesterase